MNPPDFPPRLAAIKTLVQAGHAHRVEQIADRCGNAPLAIKFVVIKFNQERIDE